MSRSPIVTMPAREITLESVYLRRRELIKAALLPMGLLAGCGSNDAAESKTATVELPGRPLPATSRSPFSSAETQTTYQDATSYNNYYEFGTGKADPAAHSSRFKAQPWTVEIAGAAETTGRFALEDLLKPHALEERIYRMRCVEGWSMVIPWIGFPLGDLLRRFKPTANAKYVAFTTIARPEEMPGLSYAVLDWPYREGLRMDEAMHPLTILAVGLYGRELPNQNGAPLRLVVPWKYGYKGIKSIVRIEFTERQPATAWNLAAPDEYGFFSNVNPAVDHPRWSQSSERRISGSGSKLFADRIDTLSFNGYAEQVAALYSGMDLKRDF